jgi:hypothetical protein
LYTPGYRDRKQILDLWSLSAIDRSTAANDGQASTSAGDAVIARRMAKKPFQQGRSEGKPEAYSLGYVEGLSEARTKLEGLCAVLR